MSRKEIENLLAEIGKPGENREEKLKKIRELNKKNPQGYDLSETLSSYRSW